MPCLCPLTNLVYAVFSRPIFPHGLSSRPGAHVVITPDVPVATTFARSDLTSEPLPGEYHRWIDCLYHAVEFDSGFHVTPFSAGPCSCSTSRNRCTLTSVSGRVRDNQPSPWHHGSMMVVMMDFGASSSSAVQKQAERFTTKKHERHCSRTGESVSAQCPRGESYAARTVEPGTKRQGRWRTFSTQLTTSPRPDDQPQSAARPFADRGTGTARLFDIEGSIFPTSARARRRIHQFVRHTPDKWH